MPTTIDTLRLEDRFLDAFQVHSGHRLNGRNAHLRSVRQEAIDHFQRLGFPDRKAEAWKYTNIGKVLKHDFALQMTPPARPLTPSDLTPYLIPDLDAYTVVLVNGAFDPDLSSLEGLPKGVLAMSLSDAADRHPAHFDAHFARYADAASDAFVALNTAFTHDGLFLYVPAHVELDRPFYVLHLLDAEDDRFFQPRHLYVAEANTRVRIIEAFQVHAANRSFTNNVTEIAVGAGARVEQYRLQNQGPEANQVATTSVYQHDTSYFSTHTVTLSGAVVRNTLHALPDAEHCETHLYGLILGSGQMHVDNHTLVDHARPNCFSNELYKNILDDASSGVFNGKVLVRPHAQKTNAYQSNKSILLSDTARIDAKPELEIYADDVKCSHGATTGQLDTEALFYLRSRGLSPRQARALLLLAFARDVVDTVEPPALRAYLDSLIAARF